MGMDRRRFSVVVVASALSSLMVGCSDRDTPQPLAKGRLEYVTIWHRPVQRPGETGSNNGTSPEKGSRVEVYENFILVTPRKGPRVLAPHGWYTDLSFVKD